MSENNNNIHFIKFREDNVPVFKVIRSKDYVFYGKDNLYPEYLIDMFTKSGKHNAICTQKAAYIKGYGWSTSGIIANRTKETFDKILEKVALDITIFGGFCLQCIWRNDMRGLAEVYHVPFHKVRVSANKDVLSFSNDWGRYRPEKVQYPAFSQTPDRETRSSLLYVTEYRPNDDVYPLPDYIGAIKWIELDTHISVFHLNNIKNNFWGGAILSFNTTIPTAEEQDEIVRKIREKYTGADNAGDIIITFSNGKDRAPTIERIPADNLDKQFEIINGMLQDEIFTGHRVTSPMLFGIRTAGQLGGRDELLMANALFQENYVAPKQLFLEEQFKPIFNLMGISQQMTIIPLEILRNNITARRQEHKKEHNCQCFEDDKDKELERIVLSEFGKYGRDAAEYEIISRKPVDESYLLFIGSDEQKVLKILNDNPKESIRSISKAVGIDEQAVRNIIKNLIKNDLITPAGVVTEKGLGSLDDKPVLAETEILYSYDVDPQFGEPIIPTTRDFCRTMLTQYRTRLWTREEIDMISQGLIKIGAVDVDWNVWRYRGGWYYRKDIKVSQPFCRHLWYQNVAIKRR